MPRHATRGNTDGRGGGHAATWLPPLADEFFAYENLKISWVTFDYQVARTEIDRDGNQEFVRLPEVKTKVNIFLRQWPARLLLRRALQRIQPDIVHVWGTECLYAIALKDVRVSKILSVQGCLTAFNKVWNPSYVHQVLGEEEPDRVREADIVTCESPWSAEQIRLLDSEADIRVVDYGVHPSFNLVEWNPDPDDPVLLYSGSLDYRKGIDVLIEALKLLPERKWRCQIVGEGPLRSALEKENLSGVEWLGTLRWKELQHRLSRAWALVVPTRADTGPTVVKEARVVGLPVVGSVHGGLRDYIRNGESGLTVDPLDARNLAAACQDVMSDFVRVRRLGLSHREADRASFSPSLTAKRFASIYEELSESATRQP